MTKIRQSVHQGTIKKINKSITKLWAFLIFSILSTIATMYIMIAYTSYGWNNDCLTNVQIFKSFTEAVTWDSIERCKK